MSKYNSVIRRTASLAIAFLLSFLTVLPASSLTPIPQQSAAVDKQGALALALEPRKLLPTDVAVAIAEYTDGSANEVRQIFASFGASSAILPDGYQEFSTASLLKWAFVAAERNKKGAGNQFLRAFIEKVSSSAPSILDDPFIKKYMKGPAPTTQQFVFAAKTSLPPPKEIDPAIRRVIAIVADTVSGRGSMFTARRVMEQKLGLKPEEVLDSMSKFGSSRDALIDKLTRLPNPPQKEKIAEIALEILERIIQRMVPLPRSNYRRGGGWEISTAQGKA
jgi:hypothetical protein